MYNEDVKSIAEFPFSKQKDEEFQENKLNDEVQDQIHKLWICGVCLIKLAC